jgi:16S rRNA (uracil1498-N3)-methyltransferase
VATDNHSADSADNHSADSADNHSPDENSENVGPASVDAAAQVFVGDLATFAIDPEDVHHLSRVLRLRPGETVVASDGLGSWRACSFTGSVPWLDPVGEVANVARASPEVSVAFTPVKGDRPEWVVQKLVEIGVDRVVVLRSERSVVVWDGQRADRAIDRLAKIAAQAAAQSRRVWIPRVLGVTSISDLARSEPVVLAERGGGPLSLGSPVCVGPEGGWTEEELGLGSGMVGLGQGVLRAETASIVAGALLCALRDGDFSQ